MTKIDHGAPQEILNASQKVLENIKTLTYEFGNWLFLSVPFLPEIRLGTSRLLDFIKIWHYLARSEIKGDYLEFGVWCGTSFKISLRSAAKFYPRNSKNKPRFFAFDSFEGLSSPSARFDKDNYQRGQYQCSQDKFNRNIRSASRGWDIITIKGFYKDSLKKKLYRERKMQHAAFVMIDCDLYEPTLQTLRFVTPLLQTGSIIYFDDWFYCQGSMKHGEAAACAKWLEENPNINLIDFGNSSVMAKYFIVNID